MLGPLCQNTPVIVFDLSSVSRDESIRRALAKVWRAPYGAIGDNGGGGGGGVNDYHETTPEDAGRRYDIYEVSREGMLEALRGKSVVHSIDAGSFDEQLVFEQCRETMQSSDGTLLPIAAEPADAPPTVASHIETAVVLQTCMRIAQQPQDARCRFVGSHPVSLQRRHFAQLTEHNYVVSRKMNGERALLLVMNGRFWMVLRNFVVWRSRWDAYLQQQKELWLLDAEWIEATKTFCIIDVCSQEVAHLPILRRLHTLAENPLLSVLSKCFNNCRVYVQRYFAFADFRMIEKPQTEEMDGYIFTPQALPYRYGRDSNMFKAKELKNNSADLQVDGAGRLYVKDTEKGVLEPVGQLVNFDPAAMPVNSILECIPVDETAQRWLAQKLRSDKLEPNEAWVYKRVVESIRENITFQEVADLEGVR
jgi:hypothetical protein